MELTGAYRIPASRDRVFQALCDPAILMRCIPVLEQMQRHSETDYSATVSTSLGPLKARFSGQLKLVPEDAPRDYTLHAEGKGGIAGMVRGQARIILDEADGHTELHFTLHAAFGGAVGRLAATLVRGKADRLIDGFFERFQQEIGAG